MDNPVDEPDEAPENATAGRREETDRLIIEALAMRHSQAVAAQAAGVTARTVARRLSDPRFVARVRRRQADIADEDLGRLGDLRRAQMSGAELATQKLIELLDDENAHIALGAARALSSTRHQLVTTPTGPAELSTSDGSGWSM